MVEAKARGLQGQGQGHNILSSRCPRGPPSLGFLPRDVTQRAEVPRHLSVHHSQIQRPTAASCALLCMNYEVLYLWY